jgi:hypothetical protein
MHQGMRGLSFEGLRTVFFKQPQELGAFHHPDEINLAGTNFKCSTVCFRELTLSAKAMT